MKPDELVPIKTIADHVKKSQRHVARLSAAGTLPAQQAGKMPLVASLVAFIHYQAGTSTSAELTKERLRKVQAESERIELQNELSRGSLVEVEAVYSHLQGFFVALRSRILASGLTDDEKTELLNDLRGIKARDISPHTKRP